LIFSRRDAASVELLDFNGIVQETERLLSRVLGKNIVVSLAIAPEPALVRADRSQLEQVLMNLAVNARDAMGEGGSLAIAVSVDEHEEIPGQPPGTVVLSVSDTGAGMSDEVAARAFEPFFTTKPKGDGTGLGLATVYGIVTRSGGTVTLHSQEGRGTRVEVWLPLAREQLGAAASAPAKAPPPAAGQLVLVIEDEHAVRQVAGRILSEHGYAVRMAASVEQALALAQRDTVDLLLTDVVMPGMSGPELVERLRPVLPDVPVIYMSGHNERAEELARDAVLLHKPFTASVLLEAVGAMLDGDRPYNRNGSV
jgi:CheY-like chemotaxis protein